MSHLIDILKGARLTVGYCCEVSFFLIRLFGFVFLQLIPHSGVFYCTLCFNVSYKDATLLEKLS